MIYGLFDFLALSVLPVILAIEGSVHGCGSKGKHCITRPPDCLSDTKTCMEIATVSASAPGFLRIQISSKGSRLKNRWVGLAFSKDDLMGNDAVVMCIQNDTRISAELSYNQGHGNSGSAGVDKYIHPTKLKGEDGMMHCVVDAYRKMHISGQHFDLTKPHHLLFSTGPVKTGRVLKHDKVPIVSTGPYVFS